MRKFFDQLWQKGKKPSPSAGKDPITQPIHPEPNAGNKGSERQPIYPPQMLVGLAQSVGRMRDQNEDALFTFTSVIADCGNPKGFGLFIIADGMGGHSHGELASGAAVRAVAECILEGLLLTSQYSESFPTVNVAELLEKAVEKAQRAVVKKAPGGGTTLTAALVIGEQVTFAHVGDSRGYFLFDDGQLRAMTQDHTLVQRLVDLGQLSEEQARVYPQKNVVYRALGQLEPFEPDVQTLTFPKNGCLMLCSDGLWGVVSHQEMTQIIIQNEELVIGSRKLVNAANREGGPDNISVILVRLTQ